MGPTSTDSTNRRSCAVFDPRLTESVDTEPADTESRLSVGHFKQLLLLLMGPDGLGQSTVVGVDQGFGKWTLHLAMANCPTCTYSEVKARASERKIRRLRQLLRVAFWHKSHCWRKRAWSSDWPGILLAEKQNTEHLWGFPKSKTRGCLDTVSSSSFLSQLGSLALNCLTKHRILASSRKKKKKKEQARKKSRSPGNRPRISGIQSCTLPFTQIQQSGGIFHCSPTIIKELSRSCCVLNTSSVPCFKSILEQGNVNKSIIPSTMYQCLWWMDGYINKHYLIRS